MNTQNTQNMEIVDNKALLFSTMEPDIVTEAVEHSRVLRDEGNGFYSVLVKWTLANSIILKNIGIANVPSPIIGKYDWPGMYTPFEHQRQTASFMTLHRKGFILSEQGTGKTMAAAWAADYLMRLGVVKRCLIICPLSIMQCAWQNDLFSSVMHRSVGIAHGSPAQRLKIINNKSIQFVIINYEGVESVRAELAKAKFDMIICDESTAIKNAKSKRWRMVNSIIEPETRLWLMTGTPVAHSPEDAYGQAKLVNPNSVPAYGGAFRDMVMTRLSTFRYAPKPEAQHVVFGVLQPAIRFTKAECLDLPEQLYTTRMLDMTSQQRHYYERLRKELLFEALGEEVSAVNAAVKLGKLLQITAGSVITDSGAVLEFDVSNKLREMLDVIEQSSHKVLVFCTYTHTLGLIKDFLDGIKISNESIHGGINKTKRNDIITRFQNDKDPHVLILQVNTVSHGVTLTAANTVIWFTPPTSTELYLQANARTHRSGQKNPCLVVHLSSSPVERQLYRNLETRTSNQRAFLDMYKSVLHEGA